MLCSIFESAECPWQKQRLKFLFLGYTPAVTLNNEKNVQSHNEVQGVSRKTIQNASHFYSFLISSFLTSQNSRRPQWESYVQDAGLGANHSPYLKSSSTVLAAAITSSPLPLEGRAIMSLYQGRQTEYWLLFQSPKSFKISLITLHKNCPSVQPAGRPETGDTAV